MPFTAFPIPTKVAMKADVGLGNVDNTADVNKPVSGPQQAALDGKAPLVHTHAPGDITALVEFIQDTVAAFLVQGANVTLTYDDAGNTLTIAATGGGGGGGLADGNYGDVTVSGGGTVITINSDVVTFAKMQEIATGTVIGRTTAGTGNPETITMAALKTALAVGISDVSGLTTALGGKVNTANPTSTGIAQHDGAANLPVALILTDVLNIALGAQEVSFDSSGSLTLTGTPPDTRVFGPIGITNTSSSAITRTLPSVGGLTWINDNDGSTLTELTIDANSRIEFIVRRLGAQLRVIGLPVVGGGGSGYDTPEEVRDALESLTGANRLDASAIQNLPSSASFSLVTIAGDGRPIVGETLTATMASGWAVTGQWYRDGSAISGATSLTYAPDAAGVHDFRVTLGNATFQSNQITVGSGGGGGGGSVSILGAQTSQPAFGTTADFPIPAGTGLQANDAIVLVIDSANQVSSATDDQGNTYTIAYQFNKVVAGGWATVVKCNAVTSSTMPTVVSVTFAGDTAPTGRCYVVRGAAAGGTGANGSGSFATSQSVPYTTVNGGAVFGGLFATGGGVTGFTPDGVHTWDVQNSGYSVFFSRATATGGSYNATGDYNTASGSEWITFVVSPA